MDNAKLFMANIDVLIQNEKNKKRKLEQEREEEEEEEREEGEIKHTKKKYNTNLEIQTTKTTKINLYDYGNRHLNEKYINYADHSSSILFQSVVNCKLHYKSFRWCNKKPILTVSAIEKYDGDFEKQIQALIAQIDLIPLKCDADMEKIKIY
jgi:hypothetical protein